MAGHSALCVMILVSAACALPCNPFMQDIPFESASPYAAQLLDTLHKLRLLHDPGHCYGLRQVLQPADPSQDIVFQIVVSRVPSGVANCSAATAASSSLVTSLPDLEESSVGETFATRTVNNGQKTTKDDDGRTRPPSPPHTTQSAPWAIAFFSSIQAITACLVRRRLMPRPVLHHLR
jgi:hypothetical protein